MTVIPSIYQDMVSAIDSQTESLTSSGRYNAVFDSGDIHTVLIMAARNGSCINGAAEVLKTAVAKESGISPRTPSGRHVCDTIKTVDPERMRQDAVNVVRYAYGELVRRGAISGAATVAIDITDKPRYDDGLSGGLVLGRYKNGTKKFERYITMQIVDSGYCLQVASLPMERGDTAAKFVPKLMDEASRTGIRIGTVLLDRGFFSTDVVKYLTGTGVRFVMPCPNTGNVVAALNEYAAGSRGAVSECAIEGVQKSDAYTMVITDRKSYKDGESKESEPKSKYIAFATNIPSDEVMADPERIPGLYRSRCGD